MAEIYRFFEKPKTAANLYLEIAENQENQDEEIEYNGDEIEDETGDDEENNSTEQEQENEQEEMENENTTEKKDQLGLRRSQRTTKPVERYGFEQEHNLFSQANDEIFEYNEYDIGGWA